MTHAAAVSVAPLRAPRHVLRGTAAVVAGFFTGALLSLAVDLVLHALGVYAPWGRPSSNGALALATAYRAVFCTFGCYVTARIAGQRPLFHAMLLGGLGLLVSLGGVAAAWGRAAVVGPIWYPIALVVIALPCAWLGGHLRERQLRA